VLEWRFPVRLESFSIRRGSGGAGLHRGGDGVDRRLRFLERMTATLLANRRTVPPLGLAGGADGAVGQNWITQPDGSTERLPAAFSRTVEAGGLVVIQTPGGGGFGAK